MLETCLAGGKALPMVPYSTHNLAVATALNLFRSANIARHQELESIQISSRMTVLDWVKEKKLSPLLAKAFEDTLYKIFKPKNEKHANQWKY